MREFIKETNTFQKKSVDNGTQNTRGVPNVGSRSNSVSTPFAVSGPPPTQPAPTPVVSPSSPPKQPAQLAGIRPQRRFRLGKIVLIALALTVLIGGGILAFRLLNPSPKAVNSQRTEDAASAFDTLDIPLNEVGLASQILTTRTLNINGQLKVDKSLILTPSTRPTTGIAGQMYYDSGTNQLAYYNGTGYVELGNNPQTVTSIGGASGVLTLGGGLSLSGGTLSSTGITSITSASTNLTVTNDNGNVTIANTPGAPQGVQSAGGTTGRIALFNGAQTIGDSLLSQTGNLLTAEANFQVNGAIELQAADTVTLRLTDTTSGVIGQIYNDGNLHVNGGQNNLWLDAGGSGTIFMNAANGNKVAIGQAVDPDYLLEVNGDINISDVGGSLRIGGTAICTITGCVSSGGGGGGVSSLNGLSGALTLANATGAGTTITIDDATTTTKGIASFNSTNFNVTAGAVNTVQNISTTSAPTFGQLTLTSAQASAAMLIVNNTNPGATGNLLDLRLNGTSEFAVSPLGNVTLNGTINGQTISSAANFTGTVGVTGNINTSATLFANAVSVTTNVNATGAISGGSLSITNNAGVGGSLTVTGTTSTNTITPTAALTVGSTTQAFTLQGSATSTITATGSGFTTTIGFTGTPAAAVAYNFDRAAAAGTYLICTTAGNCAGVGGGVTTAGGTTNQLAKFTGSQAIGNSIISDNGSTVTIAGTLTVNAIMPSGALTIGATSQDLTLQGANTTLSATNGGVTNSLVFATPASGNKSITIPNASGTICLTSGNCAGIGGTGDVLQGGNTFGTTMTLGSNDAFDFNLETSGVTRLSIAANGSSITLSNNTDLFLQGSSAFISNSQGSSGGEAFGFDAAVGGNAVAVGRQAIAGTGGAFGSPVAVGYQASAASWGTAIGGQSSTTGDESVAIGNSATAASQGIAIGVSASTAGDTGSIAIGFNASTTASNQLVVGSNNFGITQAFFGSGVTDATPSNFTLQATGGSGTNIAGASLTISGGAGTGNASGGNVNLQVATPGASGSAANVPVTVMSLSGTTGAALFQNAANSAVAFQVQNAGGTSVLTVDTTNTLTRLSGAGSDASLTSGTGALQIGSDTGANLAFDDNEIIARNNGATSTLFVQNGGGGVNIGANSTVVQVASNGDSLTVLNSTGNRVVNIDTAEGELELGAAATLNGAILFRNSTNSFTTLLRAPSSTAHRSIALPDADGTVCLQSSTACGFALSSGSANYIQNQNSTDQTADLRVSGTARANTSVLTPTVDTATAVALNVGGTTASAVNVGRSGINTTVTGNLIQNTGTFSLTGNSNSSITTSTNALTLTSASAATWSTTSGSLTLQSTNASNNIVINGGSNAMTLNTGSSGTITVGSANTSTVNLGALTNNARTVNVGVGTGGTQTQTVNVGSLGGSSVTNIRGGTTANAIALTTGSGGVITATATQTAVKALADNTSAFQVQNASGGFLFNVDTLNNTANLLWGTFGTGAGLDFSIDTFFSDAVLIGTGVADNVSLGNSAASINMTTGSNITAKSAVNNTSAFRVQNAANTSIFEVDTVNGASNTSYLNVNTAFNSNYRLNVTGLSKIYRATSTATDNILELNSDVGGANTQQLKVEANGNLTTLGKVTSASFGGAGLTDCDASNSKLLWDATTSQFSCGTDRASVTIRKSADESVTSSTTLQNDDSFSFTVGAGETWAFQIYADVASTAAGDFKSSITAPTGSTCRYSVNNLYNVQNYTTNLCGDPGITPHSDAFDNEYLIYGTVVTAGTAGTVQWQWAQGTSDGTATTVRAGSHMIAYKISGADLAEAYYTEDGTIAPGDVVSLDPNSAAGVVKSAKGYDTKAIGVVSTKPGQVLADPDAGKAAGRQVPIALSGRIPVKVTTENGAIHAGDFLTTSSTPGVAMKATRPGQVIGRALADFTGTGQGMVLMFASQQWADPRDPDGEQSQADTLQAANISDLSVEDATIGKLTVTGSAEFKGDVVVRGNLSTANLTVNGHIITGGDTPTAAAGSACSAADVQISGNDTSGLVTATTKPGCNNTGDLAKVTFAKAFGSPPRIALTPANADAAALKTYIDSGDVSTTSFTIATPTTINGSTTYRWYYQVMQ